MESTLVRTYVRVSTEEQALSGYSLQAQTDLLEQLAKVHGWTIARCYRDDGYSAKDMNRPGLRELLREAQAGEVILVYKLDRLTRSVRDLDDLVREFDRRGLMFRSATEQFETTTASGRLFLRIVTEIAQWERETIAERSAMGKRKKVELGEWAGGPVPFGYCAVPSDRVKAGKALLKLIPDPQRAHLLPAVFDRYLRGSGLRAICLWLNDELGVRTARGMRWRVSSLVRLLTNPLYCGDVVHGRRIRAGKVTRVPGGHPPLVSREVFERVQQLFTIRKEMAPRQATGVYPLAGIARCGVCGGPVDTCRNRKKGLYSYRCRNYATGVGCGDGVRKPLSGFAGHLAEAALVDAIHRLPHPANLSRFFEQCEAATAKKAAVESAELGRLQADLAEAESAIRRWDRAYETGALEWEAYRERIHPHQDRIRIIREQLALAMAKPAPPPGTEPAPLEMDFRKAWQHLELPERKVLLQRFVRAFGARVLLHPGRTVRLGTA